MNSLHLIVVATVIDVKSNMAALRGPPWPSVFQLL